MNISYYQILSLSLPVLLANIAMPLQSAIDTAIIGHFDNTSHLAALGVSVQLMAVLLISFNFLQYATSGLSAQAKGRLSSLDSNSIKQKIYLCSILHRALAIALLIGLLILSTQKWLIPIGFKLLSAPVEIYSTAMIYLQTRFFGVIPELMNYAFIGWFAGQGKTKLMLYQQSLIACCNIILTCVFVYYFDLGIKGVALGTACAYWVGFIFAIGLVSNSLNLSLKQTLTIHISEFTFNKLSQLFRLNFDIFIRTLLLTFSFVWITRLSSMSGELILATNALLLQILTLSAYALDGFAVTTETLCGQSWGRQDWQTLKRVIKRTAIVSFSIAGILVVGWWLSFDFYIEIMTNLSDVAVLAKTYQFYAIMLPIIGVGAYWLDGIFFGLTDGKIIRNSALLVAACFFPISYLIYHYTVEINEPMIGIWFSIWLLLLLRMLVLLIMLRHRFLNTELD